MISKVRVRNTFINLPDENESSAKFIYKSISFPALEDSLNQWYVYNLPSFEDRAKWKLSPSNSDSQDSSQDFSMKSAYMFLYSQELSDPETPCSSVTECIPFDEKGNLTSVGSVLHLVGGCKPCAFFKHRNKLCMNGLRCSFCKFSAHMLSRPL